MQVTVKNCHNFWGIWKTFVFQYFCWNCFFCYTGLCIKVNYYNQAKLNEKPYLIGEKNKTLLLFLLDREKTIHGWRQLEFKNRVLKGTVYILERHLTTISKLFKIITIRLFNCFCLQLFTVLLYWLYAAADRNFQLLVNATLGA